MMIALLLACLLQDAEFRAGAAVADATPPKFPVIVNGMFTGRTANGALDPILVRAAVLEAGATRIAFAVVDSCMVSRATLDRAKLAASKTTGIPVERMLVSSTHTHSAPSEMGCLGSDADPDYPAFLEKKISEALEKAAAALVPAEVGWAVVQAPEHTHCRRWILRPDKIRNDPFGVRSVRAMMHPGYQNPDFIGPAGPVDSGLSLLSVRTRDGKPLALLANYSMHYFGSGMLSADYAGVFCRQLAKALGADASFIPMLSQGTSGDQMWMDYGSPQKKPTIEAYTEGLTRLAVEALKGLPHRSRGSIAMQEAKLRLGRRLCDEKRLEWARGVVAGLAGRPPKSQPEIYAREQVLLHADPEAELRLQAVRINDFGITAIPNEVVGLTGLRLKAQSPLAATMNLALANGAEGYIPPPEQHRLGGYITWAARTAGLETTAEPKIVETLLGLLESVSGKPRRPFAEPDAPYARAVLASKPAAYWRLGEFTGDRAADSAGSTPALFEDGFALHLDGPDLEGSAARNRAPHFAGGRLRAELPALAAAYSVEFFFWNGFQVTSTLFSSGSAEQLTLAGTLCFNDQKGKTVVPLKTWNHVVLARDGTSVRVLLNGALEIEGQTAPRSAGAAAIVLGGAFEGKLDEVSVYARALTDAEASAHLKAAGPRAIP